MSFWRRKKENVKKQMANELAVGKGSSEGGLSQKPEHQMRWREDKGWTSGGTREVLILSS